MMTDDMSLLSRDEANAMKGILILLIMAGHCIPLVQMTDFFKGMVWLYSFHIHAFFLLPFLYPLKKATKERIVNQIVRFYVPFLAFFIPLLLIHWFRYPERIPWIKLPIVFIGGGGLFLRRFAGTQFLWFLPAMFVLQSVLSFYAGQARLGRLILLVVGSLFLVFPYMPRFFIISPLYAYVVSACKYLMIGSALRSVLLKKWVSGPMALIVFLMTSVCFFIHYFFCISPFHYGYSLSSFHSAVVLFSSISFMVMLYSLRCMLGQSCLLSYLGSHSLHIYLVHLFFGYLSFWCLQKYAVPLWGKSIVCLGMMLLGSVLWCGLLDACPVVKRLLVPKNVEDICFWRTRKGD